LILQGYAAGDAKGLARLLDPAVLAVFCSEFDRRRAEGREFRYDVVSVVCCEIVNINTDRTHCEASVRFETELFISELRSRPDGEHETWTQQLHACDLWTFRRQSGSPNQHWLLVATEAA
jgi:predicted lipid-binding transport protein (Tim44 family)